MPSPAAKYAEQITGSEMERRALLKIAALTALSQKLPMLGQMTMAHPQMPDAPYTLQFFTDAESRSLDEWMEMILPADEHSPGAHEARTNLFADHMVAASSEETRRSWREGLRLLRRRGVSLIDGRRAEPGCGRRSASRHASRSFFLSTSS